MLKTKLLKRHSRAILFRLMLCILIGVSESVLAQPDNCREPVKKSDPHLDLLWHDFESLSSREMLGRKAGTEGAILARTFIISRFDELGVKTLSEHTLSTQESSTFDEKKALFDASGWLHEFNYRGKKQGANVVGVVPGAKVSDKFIVVTAHYDHLGKKRGKIYHGANDNASGVAAMFHMVRMLKNTVPHHSIVFIATDFEEAGLYGAKAFVKDGVLAKEAILINLNLDMIAQPGRKWRLYVTGTRSQPHFKSVVDEVISSAPICIKKGHDSPSWNYNRSHRVDWRRASDHWAFAKQDIAWLYLGVEDYRYYHKPSDTSDKILPSFYFGSVISSYRLLVALDHYYETNQ